MSNSSAMTARLCFAERAQTGHEYPGHTDHAHSPTVDVLIPCSNGAHALKRCVQSVIAQEHVNVRVLIIHDAGSSQTGAIGSALAAIYRQVEFHRRETHRGCTGSCNEGLIEWSRSKYCMVLSSDDVLVPECLRRAVDIMENDRTIGMVYGRAGRLSDIAQLPKTIKGKVHYIPYSDNDWINARCKAGGDQVILPWVVVRGSVQRKVGGYRKELPRHGDLEMWLRIASQSNVAYMRGPALVYRRSHSDNVLWSKYQNRLSDFVEWKAAFDTLFRYYVDTTGNAFRMHDSANRALAREALQKVCRAYEDNQADREWVTELANFAIKSYPKATSLSEYSALRRRIFVGPLVCHRTQLFIVSALAGRVMRWLRNLRWRLSGI